MKKIIAIATVLTVAAMVAGPGPAQATTIEDLEATIADLQTQLTAALAQLTALGGTVSGVGVSCTFTRNLYPGVSGTDVKCLQEYLNDAGNTLAATGPGSPGSETEYYGPLTKAAVGAWQVANGVVYGNWQGYFGPLSQTKYNALAAATPTPTPTPTECATDADCDTGYECVDEVCVAEEPSEPSEGTFTVILAASPADANYRAGTDKGVYGIEFTAEDSDITIGRLDIQMAVTVAGVSYDPSTFINRVAVYDGDTLVKEKSSPSFTRDANNLYYTRLISVGFVVPDGETKTLTIKVDTVTDFDTNRTLQVRIYGTNGIRGRDTVGIDTYVALATPRTFILQRAGLATLTATVSGNSPVSANNEWDVTDGIQSVELLRFNVRATVGDATMSKVAVTAASGASQIIPTIVYLKDSGGDVISSATDSPNSTVNASGIPIGGIYTFENFTHVIPVGTAEEFTVIGDFPATANAEPNSGNNTAALTMAGTSANNQFRRADGATVNTTITAFTGSTQYLFIQGLQIALSGTPTNVVTNDGLGHGTAKGIISFNVTPFGGNLTNFRLASAASGVADEVTVLALLPSGAIYTTPTEARVLVQEDANGDGQTADGETSKVTVTFILPDDGSTNPGLVRFEIQDIAWEVGGAAAAHVGQRWGIANFITPWADLR